MAQSALSAALSAYNSTQSSELSSSASSASSIAVRSRSSRSGTPKHQYQRFTAPGAVGAPLARSLPREMGVLAVKRGHSSSPIGATSMSFSNKAVDYLVDGKENAGELKGQGLSTSIESQDQHSTTVGDISRRLQQQKKKKRQQGFAEYQRQRRTSTTSSSGNLSTTPMSPNMFPFSPPLSGVRVVQHDKPRRGSNIVTTTILSPFDGDIMFSSSFDERDSMLGDDDDIDMDDIDVDDMVLDDSVEGDSDTDEEDWQSAGVESLRRGNAFAAISTDRDRAASSVSSDSVFSLRTTATSVSSARSSGQPDRDGGNGLSSKSFSKSNDGMDIDRPDREVDAIQALVQLRSL
ncbi:uncharacterized protein V1516DRAFT_461891 [Lipomyces oligophaga]|uniref:uncharacterized protein n=1 Tax=Lipomyces oligophaga TaxID=45792 RepID=UPI0034CE2139